nr:hypothetical protein [uncultured bacterium]
MQTVKFVVLATTELTTSCNVAMESHPPLLVSVTVYVPVVE